MNWSFPAHVVVVSPHLDDAVFSLAASILQAVRSGTRVEVLTVFACDPASNHPANGWDARAGFATEGEAATARRVEDQEACDIVGAEPRWLPFRGGGYTPHKDRNAIWTAIADAVTDADAVLVPGFPLTNPDHAWLADLLTEQRSEFRGMGLYAEQPYRYFARRATQRLEVPAQLGRTLSGAVEWTKTPSGIGDRRLKRKAILAYASQIPLLGFVTRHHLKLDLMLLHEALHRGEALAWLML